MSGLLQFFQHQEGGRKGSIYMTQRPSERLRVTQILSGGAEILNHKDFFFLNPAFFLQVVFTSLIINTRGRIWLCRKRRETFLPPRRKFQSTLPWSRWACSSSHLYSFKKKKKREIQLFIKINSRAPLWAGSWGIPQTQPGEATCLMWRVRDEKFEVGNNLLRSLRWEMIWVQTWIGHVSKVCWVSRWAGQEGLGVVSQALGPY